MILSRILCILILTACIAKSDTTPSTPVLQPNDLIAICGDSITEQRKYSAHMAAYFLMCQPEPGLRSMQLGQGGENASIFSRRLLSQVLPFAPDIVTTCYGMNDGGYTEITPERIETFRINTQSFVDALFAGGVRQIVLGSTGAVDPQTFSKSGRSTTAEIYNKALGELAIAAREVAEANNLIYVDIHSLMLRVIQEAEEKYGPDYYVAGADGIHASENGQFLMSYAFLKALNCSGNIGTIVFDAKTSEASSTAGHEVIQSQDGIIELESTRYPFCVWGDPASPNDSIGMLEFVPFNQELNRYILVVENAPKNGMTVTWGDTSKTFSQSSLAEGINLANEFLENPFVPQFKKVMHAIKVQQSYESRTIRSHLRMQEDWKEGFPDAYAERPEVFDWQQELIVERAAEKIDETASLVVPIQHTIQLSPIE